MVLAAGGSVNDCLCSRDESQPAMIADESVDKPEGWLDDEPEFVHDPSSERPTDWCALLSLLFSCSCSVYIHEVSEEMPSTI